jgi:hypothetical protein
MFALCLTIYFVKDFMLSDLELILNSSCMAKKNSIKLFGSIFQKVSYGIIISGTCKTSEPSYY